MATKLTLGAHAAKALMEQAKRFDAMSVHLAKSADLATSQADEIAKWTSKLIDAVTKIRRETQDEAAACRERVQDTRVPWSTAHLTQTPNQNSKIYL
jgi:1,2-phenylacetyl-CoA epoxidase PaaB subunit